MGQTTQPQSIDRFSTQTPVVLEKQTTSIPFSGYKTYMIAGAMVVYALLGIYLKYMQSTDAITLILQALGLVGLRLGIAAQSS